ncbi:hypothetical protein DL95DRAFT_401019 [Leptodontidium sp. 2 PMI_412]|nr:hypothetical protein DL95DRAFT_401019 [Leptodontidium sp. 2 PMI_412]
MWAGRPKSPWCEATLCQAFAGKETFAETLVGVWLSANLRAPEQYSQVADPKVSRRGVFYDSAVMRRRADPNTNGNISGIQQKAASMACGMCVFFPSSFASFLDFFFDWATGGPPQPSGMGAGGSNPIVPGSGGLGKPCPRKQAQSNQIRRRDVQMHLPRGPLDRARRCARAASRFSPHPLRGAMKSSLVLFVAFL